MNLAYANSPDAAFRIIAAKRHPCAHRVTDANGLVTITFVHVFSREEPAQCSRCKNFMPVTFWQFTNKPAAEQNPS